MVSNIKSLCGKNGVTIAELERTVGLGNGTIARWDENAPSVARVKLVADYFKVSIDELLKEDAACTLTTGE